MKINILPPVSNIVLEIEEDCSCSKFLALLKALLIQFDGLSFILGLTPCLNIYIDFSKTTNLKNNLKLMKLIVIHLKHSLIRKIVIITRLELLNELLLGFVVDKNLKLALSLNSDNYQQASLNRYDQFININFLISDKDDLKNIYNTLNKKKFCSLDFILPDKLELPLFTKKIIDLADYYLTQNTDLPILSINQMVKNYLNFKLDKSISLQNASLVIYPNGDILKTVNYFYSKNKSYFLEKWNIFKDKIINVIITNEYEQYCSCSSLNILYIYSIHAINEFGKCHKKEDCEYKHPLVLFYKYFSEHFDNSNLYS